MRLFTYVINILRFFPAGYEDDDDICGEKLSDSPRTSGVWNPSQGYELYRNKLKQYSNSSPPD